MVFYWRLSDSKSSQVSRTLLSILAVFNNADLEVGGRVETNNGLHSAANFQIFKAF